MKKAALGLRAALMILTLTVGLLTIRSSGPGIERFNISSLDVGALEELFCQQCGEMETFWVDYTIEHSGQLTPEDSQQIEEPYTPPGIHGRMSMCLNCAVINSDLSPDDPRFGTNLFRLEPCTTKHWLEDIRYKSIDAAYHEMTATNIVYCIHCGDSRSSGPVAVTEPHDFTAEVVAPTCAEEGYTVYTCALCGYYYQGDWMQATGHPFGEWVVDREPDVNGEGMRHRECSVCGGIETEFLPRLEPEPEPTTGPGSGPTTEPEPKPTTEPGPEPTTEPEPESSTVPELKPTTEPQPEPTPEPEPEPTPESVHHNAYVFGRDDGSFAPSAPLIRAEAAVMIARLLPEEKTTEPLYFSDVPENAWYAPSVERLAALGVIHGKGDNIFDPGAPTTRAEFTAMAVRFFEAIGGQMKEDTHSSGFLDVPEGHWATSVIRAAAAMGWLRGGPDGLFRPEEPITRAESVAILNRVLERRTDRSYVMAHLTELRTFVDVDSTHWAWYDILEAANSHTAHLKEQEIWSR